jgi:uncharacterized membrane protein YjjP (DUF1212 family)
MMLWGEVMRSIDRLKEEEVLNIAVEVGKILLINGAETSLSEYSIAHICRCRGMENIKVFCTPTVILVGEEKPNGYNCVTRVFTRTNNLTALGEIHSFIENFEDWDLGYEDTLKYLEIVDAPIKKKTWKLCIAAGLVGGCYAVMLGGNFADFVSAMFAAAFAMLVMRLVQHNYKPILIWENALVGLALGFVACIATKSLFAGNMAKVIAGCVMPFVPGVAFTNSMLDYMAGDLVSGNARFVEALFIAGGLALGIGLGIYAYMQLGGLL